MSEPLIIEADFHLDRTRAGRKEIRLGDASEAELLPVGRLPRVTRLLALAHRFEQLLANGIAKDYAELAELGQVTRARVTQIMNLLLLAPDIQEAILFMPLVERGRDPVTMKQLQPVALTLNWIDQRKRWGQLA